MGKSENETFRLEKRKVGLECGNGRWWSLRPPTARQNEQIMNKNTYVLWQKCTKPEENMKKTRKFFS